VLFKKISNSDKWVILKQTENNPRNAVFWGRRVRMILNAQPQWLFLPLQKPEQPGVIGVPINEITNDLSDPILFRKALPIVESNYKKAPYSNDVFPVASSFFNSDEVLMEKRNMSFMKIILEKVEIKIALIYSDILGCSNTSTNLSVKILKKVGATVYLFGNGASGYQKDELFAQNGITLEHSSFTPTAYFQLTRDSFVLGLSVVDGLMNLGFDGVRKLI